jgi:hypothetical protein
LFRKDRLIFWQNWAFKLLLKLLQIGHISAQLGHKPVLGVVGAER